MGKLNECKEFFDEMKTDLEYIDDKLENLTKEQKKSLGATVYAIQGIIGRYTKDNWNTIQELIDKETPMKPRRVGRDFIGKVYECDSCKTFERYTNIECKKRCDNCGQRIDWSDGE